MSPLLECDELLPEHLDERRGHRDCGRQGARISPRTFHSQSPATSSCTESFEFPKDTSVAVDVLWCRKLYFIGPGLQPQLWGLYRSVEVQEAGWAAAICAAGLQR